MDNSKANTVIERSAAGATVKTERMSDSRNLTTKPARSYIAEESDEESLHATFMEPSYAESEQESEESGEDITYMLNEAGNSEDATSLFEYEDVQEETSAWMQYLCIAAENLSQGLTFMLGPSIADTALDAIDYYAHFFPDVSTEPGTPGRRSKSMTQASPPHGSNSASRTPLPPGTNSVSRTQLPHGTNSASRTRLSRNGSVSRVSSRSNSMTRA